MNFEKEYKTLENIIKSYNNNFDSDVLYRAFKLGEKAHQGQSRNSGKPYYSHCIAVAKNLADKKMDLDTIITALLHDTVEDTSVTIEDIEKQFGTDVANLVAGVTKLEALENSTEITKQGENFRKLLLAMSDDIRVLLVKLSDRLHNIKTLKYIEKYEKRMRIATETMEIYIPLVARIGIRDWQEQMEDICFSILNPDAHSSITKRLNDIYKNYGDSAVENIIYELSQLITDSGIDCKVEGRKKSASSIWRKMKNKHVGFEQLSDIIAFRIVLENIEDCYRVLGLVHAKYKTIPGRFKDYISVPKNNNYQSLHTGIIGPLGQRIEIQIRTKEMHDFSEMGVAAHWNYKSDKKIDIGKEGKSYRWLRELLEIIENSGEFDEFLKETKIEMYSKNVFVFSPKGDIYNLPKGATTIDFAYAVHSRVGDKAVGARINGKVMPIRTELNNGDQIEIITQSNAEPKESWKSFAVSGKARSAIRSFIRNKKSNEYIETGKNMIFNEFNSEGVKLNDKHLESLYKKYNCKDLNSYYIQLAENNISLKESLHFIYPELKNKKQTNKIQINKKSSVPELKGKASMIGGLIDGMNVRFPKCCHAIPGDKIVGIVYTGQGISIHNINCQELKKEEDIQAKSIDVYWKDCPKIDDDKKNDIKFTARINVIFSNTTGSLNEITNTINNLGINIVDLKVLTRTEEFWDVDIDVEVKKLEKLTELITSIRIIKNIYSVSRV